MNKCLRCGMDAGHLGLCRMCVQNDLIEEQNRILERNQNQTNFSTSENQPINIVFLILYSLPALIPTAIGIWVALYLFGYI